MARSYFELPLTPAPQRFSIFLGTAQWNITLRWNHMISHWTLDFYDFNNVLVLAGLPITTGVDLLKQYQHLGFSGSLFAQTEGDSLEPPNFTNLGKTSHLIFAYDKE